MFKDNRSSLGAVAAAAAKTNRTGWIKTAKTAGYWRAVHEGSSIYGPSTSRTDKVLVH